MLNPLLIQKPWLYIMERKMYLTKRTLLNLTLEVNTVYIQRKITRCNEEDKKFFLQNSSQLENGNDTTG